MMNNVQNCYLITAPAFSTANIAAVPVEDYTFVEAWKKVSPNIEPPKTPLSFMKPRPPTPASIPSKLTVNFVLPYRSEISNKEVCFPFSLIFVVALYSLFDLICFNFVLGFCLVSVDHLVLDLIAVVVIA